MWLCSLEVICVYVVTYGRNHEKRAQARGHFAILHPPCQVTWY